MRTPTGLVSANLYTALRLVWCFKVKLQNPCWELVHQLNTVSGESCKEEETGGWRAEKYRLGEIFQVTGSICMFSTMVKARWILTCSWRIHMFLTQSVLGKFCQTLSYFEIFMSHFQMIWMAGSYRHRPALRVSIASPSRWNSSPPGEEYGARVAPTGTRTRAGKPKAEGAPSHGARLPFVSVSRNRLCKSTVELILGWAGPWSGPWRCQMCPCGSCWLNDKIKPNAGGNVNTLGNRCCSHSQRGP